MFKAAALGSSFLEGELMMRVTKRPRPVVKKKKKTTRKRATSRKRR